MKSIELKGTGSGSIGLGGMLPNGGGEGEAMGNTDRSNTCKKQSKWVSDLREKMEDKVRDNFGEKMMTSYKSMVKNEIKRDEVDIRFDH